METCFSIILVSVDLFRITFPRIFNSSNKSKFNISSFISVGFCGEFNCSKMGLTLKLCYVLSIKYKSF